MDTPPQLAGIKATLGDELYQKITSCKVLLVGSGGIGCELLKNLALCGFKHVEVIDLDIIDVSNLNSDGNWNNFRCAYNDCSK